MNDTGTSIEQTKHVQPDVYASENLPVRKGSRPATVRGPLHIQCNGHGDRQYLHQLVTDVLSWPHIESKPPSGSRPDTIPIRLDEAAAANDSTAFISPREFARVLLGAPTIYSALPLVCFLTVPALRRDGEVVGRTEVGLTDPKPRQ